MAEPRAVGHTGRIQSKRRFFLCLFFIVRVLFVRLAPDFEVMDVAFSSLFFFADEQGHLLGIGRSDLFADEDVGKGLVVVEETTVRVGEEEVVVEFF